MPLSPVSRKKGVKTLRQNYQDRRASIGIGTNPNALVWGYNDYGQLGQWDRTPRSSPIFMPQQDWVHVAMGNYETWALKNDGTLWAWGYNANGQLGQNNQVYHSSPVQVTSATDWADFSIVEGGNPNQFKIFRKRDGSWWGLGYNGYGQLGLNDTIPRSSPVQVGINTTGPGAIGAKAWNVICANDNTVCAIASTDQTLWMWGRGDQGQFGILARPNYSNPTQIGTDKWIDASVGGNHFVGIRTDNTIWAYGQNDQGQLGQNDTAYRSSPIQIGTTTGWTKCSAGSNHTAAVRSGNLWTWGYNNYGQLGLNDTTPRSSPNQASYDYVNGHALDVYTPGNARTYVRVGYSTVTGYNQYYGMGFDQSYQMLADGWREGTNDYPRSSPVPVGPYWTNTFYQDQNRSSLDYPEYEYLFYVSNNVALNKAI